MVSWLLLSWTLHSSTRASCTDPKISSSEPSLPSSFLITLWLSIFSYCGLLLDLEKTSSCISQWLMGCFNQSDCEGMNWNWFIVIHEWSWNMNINRGPCSHGPCRLSDRHHIWFWRAPRWRTPSILSWWLFGLGINNELLVLMGLRTLPNFCIIIS